MISKVGKMNWKGVKDYLHENPDKCLLSFEELDGEGWIRGEGVIIIIKSKDEIKYVHPLFEYDLYVKDTK